jgi:hypothetical protein
LLLFFFSKETVKKKQPNSEEPPFDVNYSVLFCRVRAIFFAPRSGPEFGFWRRCCSQDGAGARKLIELGGGLDPRRAFPFDPNLTWPFLRLFAHPTRICRAEW